MNVRRNLFNITLPLWVFVFPFNAMWLSADDSSGGIEFFEQRIRPLLIEHCYECHAAEEQSGGLRLDTRDGWQLGGDSGPAIIVGEPDRSRMVEAVRYDNLDLQMPPSGKLPAAEIAALEEWIQRGAPDPREAVAKPGDVGQPPAAQPALKGMSIEEGREFWSLRPVSNPSVPTTQDANWVTTPIDAFILAQLEAEGLSPAPPADKRELIRRVTFDLIGLPPTPGEVAAFLADDSHDAFQKLCERLLASPQYGERWGRHWLDVARYADSNGLDENLAFGNAWRYRDYVIQAFNDDKPFDRFLTEQIAGDLVSEPTVETLTATGFLVLGAKVLAEPDREKLVMDTIDEQIDATGKAFMGMTWGCARCHDHKFDPFLQTDYYALAAFFKSTQTFAGTNTGAIKHWNEHLLASDAELQALQEVEAKIAAKKQAAAAYKTKAVDQIRSNALQSAPQYFAAASLCAPQPSLTEARSAAAQYGLHARILHNFRSELELRRDDPALSIWHQMLAEQALPEAIAERFASLLQLAKDNPPADASGTEQSAEGAANGLAADAEVDPAIVARLELARHLQGLIPELLVVPVQPEYALDEVALQAYYDLLEEARVIESDAPDASSVMGVRDGRVLVSVPIHIRGSHRNLGEPVHRGFPQALATSRVPPVFPRQQSGRLELAQWMASSQHPLTARVYVNRIWRWHFGRGIVASTENFGVLGAPPSHPELLDWLARYFMESGWSTKELHRLLLNSQVYQMASLNTSHELRAAEVDPDNRLLWKFSRRRLEAEEIRDALLAVSRTLDQRLGGKSVPLRNRQFVFDHTSKDYTRYDSLRRAVYLPIIRNNLYTLFEQFDFPDATMPTGNRQETVVAPQALLLLNDSLVMDAAAALASRVCQDFSQSQARVDWTYQICLGRNADAGEMERGLAFVARIQSQLEGEPNELEAWSLFCQALMASNEFMFVD